MSITGAQHCCCWWVPLKTSPTVRSQNCRVFTGLGSSNVKLDINNKYNHTKGLDSHNHDKQSLPAAHHRDKMSLPALKFDK
jgi:hypothetical protein